MIITEKLTREGNQMAAWRYPNYLPKPPHLMTEADWAEYRQGLSKQQMSERYSGITSDLIPTFEMIQTQGAGEIDPDPYKRQNVTTPGKMDQLSLASSGDSSASALFSNGVSSQDGASASQDYASNGNGTRALPTDQSLNYLPSREEMNGHYLDGEGESVIVPIEYLPLDEINWNKATESSFSQISPGFYGFVSDEVLVSFYGTRAGGVLGQMKFDLAGTLEVYEDETFDFDGGVDATGGGDMYDFEMHPGISEWPRNVKTWLGKPRGDREPETRPQPFFIEIPGTYAIQIRGRL